MSHNWHTSKRPPDPPNWHILRANVINRAGGICQDPDGCAYKGTDVDHIVNLANGGTHDLNNLQLLCSWHHKRKTAQESARARVPLTESRPRATHPGLVNPG